ncbi:excisionase family DNA-binding protein [Nocardioides taihuensis]|uniref:Excisionase family DNA-binding protein n=1 Tax=Nocardioides taihuensis TaxID=1835606 RepID=A0ABW0BEC4_9ACTN
MTQQLHNLSQPDQVDGSVTIRANVWLMSSEELPPLLFSPDEVSRLLSLGRHRVFDLIRDGRLRSVKVGSSRRISARALADYVAALESGEAP